jgi:hypothetical protein
VNDHITNGVGPINVAVPNVHLGVVQALSDALTRAQRGEIHGVILVGVRGSDLASFDTVVCDQMTIALMLSGAIDVAKAKITNGAIAAQQNVPANRIVRAPAGMVP